eukprot:TRINITY_DN18509_c0_g1_i1.p1 TRINITY_DN18509_c0_g1~~TRINITY_DN18509_c0_g1_i1.p1  ORF type:complete len:274 (-),score=70.64 TRINITY_DN18509_c0_g1_i1:80-874(-)
MASSLEKLISDLLQVRDEFMSQRSLVIAAEEELQAEELKNTLAEACAATAAKDNSDTDRRVQELLNNFPEVKPPLSEDVSSTGCSVARTELRLPAKRWRRVELQQQKEFAEKTLLGLQNEVSKLKETELLEKSTQSRRPESGRQNSEFKESDTKAEVEAMAPKGGAKGKGKGSPPPPPPCMSPRGDPPTGKGKSGLGPLEQKTKQATWAGKTGFTKADALQVIFKFLYELVERLGGDTERAMPTLEEISAAVESAESEVPVDVD